MPADTDSLRLKEPETAVEQIRGFYPYTGRARLAPSEKQGINKCIFHYTFCLSNTTHDIGQI